MMLKFLQYQWCRPDGYWLSGSENREVEYAGAVAIKTSAGWLVLAEVLENIETGEIVRQLVKPDSIPTVECKF